MATCAPTTRARALTFLNLVQSREAHTANVRTLPTTGGVEATSARGAAAGAARRPLAPPDACARPSARSMPSKRVAVARGDDGASLRGAGGIAAAVTVAARSRKGADRPNVPAP